MQERGGDALYYPKRPARRGRPGDSIPCLLLGAVAAFSRNRARLEVYCAAEGVGRRVSRARGGGRSRACAINSRKHLCAWLCAAAVASELDYYTPSANTCLNRAYHTLWQLLCRPVLDLSLLRSQSRTSGSCSLLTIVSSSVRVRLFSVSERCARRGWDWLQYADSSPVRWLFCLLSCRSLC